MLSLRDITAEGVEVGDDSRIQPQPDFVFGAAIYSEARRSRYLRVDRLAIPVEGFADPFAYWNRASRIAAGSGGLARLPGSRPAPSGQRTAAVKWLACLPPGGGCAP